jgi:alanine racemase
MDLTAVDVTDLVEAKGSHVCSVGELAVIFGHPSRGAPTAWEVARLCSTIPYEVLTAVAQRVVRHHVHPRVELAPTIPMPQKADAVSVG